MTQPPRGQRVMKERHHWEKRYATGETGSPGVSSLFLRENIHRLPRGRALDIACGDGRHALFLAGNGYRVEAVDLALTGLRRLRQAAKRDGLALTAIQADLEHFPLRRERYDVVVNIRYLQRSLWPELRTALRPGGVIVFETFTTEQRKLGSPSNPDFLLEPGELHEAFRDFELLDYQEGMFNSEGGPAHLARMLARRPMGMST